VKRYSLLWTLVHVYGKHYHTYFSSCEVVRLLTLSVILGSCFRYNSVLVLKLFMPATIHGPIPVAARSKAWVTGGGHGCPSLVSVVCCYIEASAWGWSIVQRSRTGCGVSECDSEDSIMRSPRPTGLLRRGGGGIHVLFWLCARVCQQ
jgi:hypothetical protein